MMKNKIILASGITLTLVCAFVAKAIISAPKSDCVNVYVDYGVLNHGAKSETCVPVKNKLDAMTILNMDSIAIIGTQKYGTQIACRVNSFPDAITPIPVKGHKGYVEKCTDMPAEFAYWALLVKRGTSSISQWGWSDKGVQDLQLNAGDSVALVFTINDKVKWPN